MLKKFRFQTVLFLSYSLVVLIIVTTIFTAFYIYMSDNISKSTERNLEQLCQKTISQIDIMINDLDRTALYIVTNPFTNGLFEQYGQNQAAEADTFFNQVSVMDMFKQIIVKANVARSSTSRRISIYNDRGNYISAGFPDDSEVIAERMEDSGYKKWLSILDAGQDRIVLPPHDDFWSDDQDFKPISVIRGLYNLETYKKYGVIEIQGPYKDLKKIMDIKTNEDMVSMLLSQDGSLIYSSGNERSKELASFYYERMKHLKSGNLLLTNPVTGKKEIIDFERSDLSGWFFVISVPRASLLSTVRLTGAVLFLTALGIIILTTLAILILSRQMAKPLNTLRDSVRNVSLENLSINLDTAGDSNEINQLNEAFNTMFNRLRESMDELVTMRSHEIKAHMIALQSQMDPHFIYNTLSLVTAYSREMGIDKVTEVSSRLSGMLRYITSYKEDFVPLEKEFSHVENYLMLMKSRYEEQFEFTFDIEENIMHKGINIPKLTLQPVVENSFQHGFKNILPPWNICIKAYTKENLWIIEIKDNGTGISDGQISEIYKKVKDYTENPSENIMDLKLGGMGLINTLVRLRLLYKKDFILNIESGNNGQAGCKITIGGTLDD